MLPLPLPLPLRLVPMTTSRLNLLAVGPKLTRPASRRYPSHLRTSSGELEATSGRGGRAQLD